jgi:hypothetical protein
MPGVNAFRSILSSWTSEKGEGLSEGGAVSAADNRFIDGFSEHPGQGGEGENGASISSAVVFLGHRLSGHDPGHIFFIKQEDESDETGQARQENGIVSSHLEPYGVDIQLLERQPERPVYHLRGEVISEQEVRFERSNENPKPRHANEKAGRTLNTAWKRGSMCLSVSF